MAGQNWIGCTPPIYTNSMFHSEWNSPSSGGVRRGHSTPNKPGGANNTRTVDN